MKAGQAELLAALKAASWGALPWSGEDANRRALRIDLPGGYVLDARMRNGAPEVSLHGSGDVAPWVRSPADVVALLAKWHRGHAVRAQAAADALAQLSAMIDTVPA